MTKEPHEVLKDLVKRVEGCPEDAFHFVRDGLSYAAEQVHGPETEAHRELYEFVSSNQMDWNDLAAGYRAGGLPETVVKAIEAAGGCDKLDRHVTGRQLCWALRDFAWQRWGMLARAVLESWNIRSTADFGRIVFAFIDLNMMQKQPEDKLEDFDDVYSFDEAFDEALRDARPDVDASAPGE